MSENKPKNTSKVKSKLPETKPVVEKQAKSTKAEVFKRVSEVQALLLDGYTRSHIQQYGTKWSIAERQIDEYIRMANDNIREINKAGLEDNLAILVSALWDTFRKAKSQNNIGEQRQTLMAIAKLKGLEQTTVNHLIDDKRELVNLSNDELDAILEEEHTH